MKTHPSHGLRREDPLTRDRPWVEDSSPENPLGARIQVEVNAQALAFALGVQLDQNRVLKGNNFGPLGNRALRAANGLPQLGLAAVDG